MIDSRSNPRISNLRIYVFWSNPRFMNLGFPIWGFTFFFKLSKILRKQLKIYESRFPIWGFTFFWSNPRFWGSNPRFRNLGFPIYGFWSNPRFMNLGFHVIQLIWGFVFLKQSKIYESRTCFIIEPCLFDEGVLILIHGFMITEEQLTDDSWFIWYMIMSMMILMSIMIWLTLEPCLFLHDFN